MTDGRDPTPAEQPVPDTEWDRELIEEQLRQYQRRKPDPYGKSALFSATAPRQGSSLGALAVECSSCKRESPVRLRDVPGLVFPFSIHVPRRYHSLMKCPACGRRKWMRAVWRV